MAKKGKALEGASSHDEYMREALKDPERAKAYLEAAMEDGDLKLLLKAIKRVADARGGVSEIAKKSGLSRQSLYPTLTGSRYPRIDTMDKILETFGLRLGIHKLPHTG